MVNSFRVQNHRFLPVAIWSLLIFLGSSVPGAVVSPNETVNFLAHKAAHLFEYAVLAILSYRASRSFTLAFVYPLLFAATDEFHQSFVPGRSARIQDWLIDALAISIGNAVSFSLGKLNLFRVNGSVLSRSARATQDLAAGVLKRGKDRNTFALFGDLGSGKTTFTQGLARELGITETVNSPSFTLIKEYKIPKLKGGTYWRTLYHIDLYRLESDETGSLGIEEIISCPENLVIIEWAQRLRIPLPKKTVRIYFEYLSVSERKIKVEY